MPKAPLVRVVIADDQPLIRDSLKLHLKKDRRIHVVGEASSGEEAVNLVLQAKPDVAIFDIKMPPVTGAAAMKRLLKQGCKTRFIILTVYTNDPFLYAARDAGASSFLSKTCKPEELRMAVQSVASGNTFFSQELMDRLNQRAKGFFEINGVTYELPTQTELDTLSWLRSGKSNAEIAQEHSLKFEALKSRLDTIYDKLRVHSRIEAVMFALRQSWIDLETDEVLLLGSEPRGENVE